MKIKLFFSVLAMASMMVACGGGGSSSGGGNGNNALADIAVTDSEVVSMLKTAQSSGRGIKYYNYYTVATNPSDYGTSYDYNAAYTSNVYSYRWGTPSETGSYPNAAGYAATTIIPVWGWAGVDKATVNAALDEMEATPSSMVRI